MLQALRISSRRIVASLVPLLVLAMGPLAHAGPGHHDMAPMQVTDHSTSLHHHHAPDTANGEGKAAPELPMECCEDMSFCSSLAVMEGERQHKAVSGLPHQYAQPDHQIAGLYDPGLDLPPPRTL